MSARALHAAAPLRLGRARHDVGPPLLFAGLLGAALAFGALSAIKPSVAIALLAIGLLAVVAVRAPVAYLLALILLTGLLPLAMQSRFGTGGSPTAAGVIPTDLILLIGLARAAWVLRHEPLDRRASIALGLTLVFLGADVLQLLHAMRLGRSVSGVGSELRTLLGFGTVLMALPLLSDARTRRRLLTGLVGLGVLLGLWGVAQFVLGIQV